jgi:hypothetical protein
MGGLFAETAEELARAAQVKGGATGGKTAGRGRPKDRLGKSFPKPKRDESKRAPSQVAAAVGMSRPTYGKAEDTQDLADWLLDVDMRLGELLAAIPPKRNKEGSTQATSLPTLPPGVSTKVSHQAQTLAANRGAVEGARAPVDPLPG